MKRRGSGGQEEKGSGGQQEEGIRRSGGGGDKEQEVKSKIMSRMSGEEGDEEEVKRRWRSRRFLDMVLITWNNAMRRMFAFFPAYFVTFVLDFFLYNVFFTDTYLSCT